MSTGNGSDVDENKDDIKQTDHETRDFNNYNDVQCIMDTQTTTNVSNVWQCQQCTLYNVNDSPICAACDAPRCDGM